VGATLKIVQLGDPVLRRIARAVTPDELPVLSPLVELMRETMREAPGVGLAAPQVGESVQIVVIEDPPELHGGLSEKELAERERSAVPFHVLINPTLTILGDEVVEAFEGCLSFGGMTMVVPRARRVRVDALDESGAPFSAEATGWYARILQHEVDHLKGVVCCDRMRPRTLMSVEAFGRRWRGKSVSDIRSALGDTGE
jgi:peptide deformylase